MNFEIATGLREEAEKAAAGRQADLCCRTSLKIV
jgi:hypothetical protein